MKDERQATVALTTVGCKLNQYETEGMAELFEESGYTVVPFGETADVYVVNTCTVTMRSDYRSRQMLRRAARRNPDALVVAAGCYAQRAPQTLGGMPEVGLVVGNTAKPRVASLVAERTGGTERVVVDPHERTGFQALDIGRFRGYTRAFVKIQDGCDRRCTYCAVPAARGPARSRPFDEVVEQARRLSANGYREIVLTGVHIGAYGTDAGPGETGGRHLPELLAALAEIEDVVRIRLGSVEPTELTPELAWIVLSEDKICNHLHIPLESGSDRVLAAMARTYTGSEYADAVRRVTDSDPLCGLGADVMVGFPGETDEDFAETVALVEELPFTYLHVFAFSPREGTPAATMEGRVPSAEKKRRSRFLRDLSRSRSLAFRSGLVGERLEILVEEGSDRGGGRLSGLAGNYVRVEVEGNEELRNRFATVMIDGADVERTWGTIDDSTVR
jgi:threonylcarbamoyladenosine tRNA methylthiotransferase MtaB